VQGQREPENTYTRRGDKHDCALYFIKKGSIKTLMIKL